MVPGKPLDSAYTEKNTALVERGVENLIAHIETVKKSGIPAVVSINHFATDTDEEINIIKRAAEASGARVAIARHWEKGGDGARELAEAVVEASGEKPDFNFLYDNATTQKDRISRIATEIYGADGVVYSEEAEKKLAAIQQDPKLSGMGTCMVKTHLSLSHDPTVKGRPKGWTLPIRDVLLYRGAEFVVPVAGDIKLMPGTASDPAFRKIDVNTETGKVTGLF